MLIFTSNLVCRGLSGRRWGRRLHFLIIVMLQGVCRWMTQSKNFMNKDFPKKTNDCYKRIHTKGSCKKLASQVGQDLTHLAKAVKILARSCKLVAISLAYLQDYESCKNLVCASKHYLGHWVLEARTRSSLQMAYAISCKRPALNLWRDLDE